MSFCTSMEGSGGCPPWELNRCLRSVGEFCPCGFDLVRASAAAARGNVGLGSFEFRHIDRRQITAASSDQYQCRLHSDKRAEAPRNKPLQRGGDADGPGIALDRHPVRHRNRRRGQLQRRQLGREEDVADALVEIDPDGLLFDGNAEGKVEFDAVRMGYGSLGVRSVWRRRSFAIVAAGSVASGRLVCGATGVFSVSWPMSLLCLTLAPCVSSGRVSQLQTLIFRHGQVSHNQ